MNLKSTINRIEELTKNDLKNKTKDELLLSLIEEFGELSREIMIKEKVYGNTYKKPDEGVLGEAVDLFITSVAMNFAYEKSFNLNFSMNLQTNKKPVDLMRTITKYLNPECEQFDLISFMAYEIYSYYGGNLEGFIEYTNKKLNKWEWKCTQQ